MEIKIRWLAGERRRKINIFVWLMFTVSPMIWVPNQLIGAPKGTNVTLECNTEAFPRAISYWVYDNMMILTAVKYFTETVETNYRTHMRLTIRNLKDRDFGTYRCLSKNSLGETEGSIRLYGECVGMIMKWSYFRFTEKRNLLKFPKWISVGSIDLYKAE